MENVPILNAYRYTSEDGDISLVVWCQYCIRWHWHGAGNAPGDGDGHRIAHCVGDGSLYMKGGYCLCEIGTITKQKMQMYVGRKASGSISHAGVYVVQLLDRRNTIKIGRSRDLRKSLYGVSAIYGKLRPLLLLPSQHPVALERQLHARFAALRQYDGASPTELFVYATRTAQQALELLLHEQAAWRVESPVWTPEPSRQRGQTDGRQGQLW